MNRLIGPAALALTVAVLSGCGGSSADSTVTVTGRLLENGQPVRVSSQGLPPGEKGIRLAFVQQGAAKGDDTFPADVAPDDGTFRVPGHKNRGIPAGKYRVTVHRGAIGTPDHYQGAFASDNSPLTFTIPDGVRSINLDIDVGTKTVTPK